MLLSLDKYITLEIKAQRCKSHPQINIRTTDIQLCIPLSSFQTIKCCER